MSRGGIKAISKISLVLLINLGFDDKVAHGVPILSASELLRQEKMSEAAEEVDSQENMTDGGASATPIVIEQSPLHDLGILSKGRQTLRKELRK